MPAPTPPRRLKRCAAPRIFLLTLLAVASSFAEGVSGEMPEFPQSAEHLEGGGVPLRLGALDLYVSIAESLASVGNRRCANSTRALIGDLKNFTLWAVQMFDASAKLPGGFVSGNYYRLGDFDECMAIEVDFGSPEGEEAHQPDQHPSIIRGQYCLARLHLKESRNSKRARLGPEPHLLDPYALVYPPRSSAWETIQFKEDRSKHRRDYVYWAYCIPSTCTAKEFEEALEVVLPNVGKSYGMEIESYVDPILCQTNRGKPWSPLDYAFCVLVGFMVILSSGATLLDIYLGPSPENMRKDKGFLTNLFICFSVKNNLVHLPRKREDVGGLNVMFGIRFISTASIIVSHKFIHVLLGPIQNPGYVEQTNRDPYYTWFLHGDLVVDTFFTSGAFLLVYFLMKEMEKRKVGTAAVYVLRYVRLTPVFMFILFFYATLLNKVGSGPLWEKITASEKEKCIDNWWTNVFYINNYVNSDKMCLSHSWYLPCDTHFFALSVPLVLLLKSRPRTGIAILSLAATASAAIPFTITYLRSLDATLLVYLDSFLLQKSSNNGFLLNIYYPSHSRAGPYVVGLIAGYAHYRLKLYESKMSRYVSVPLLALGGLLMFLPMFYAAVFYVPGRAYYPLESAIYAGLHRMVWGSGIALVIIATSSGNLGPLNFILSNKLFIALGKLTYSAYLSHLLFDLISLGMTRQSFYLTTFNMVTVSIADMVYTHAAALLLYLTIECPFRDMVSLIFSRKVNKTNR